MGQLFHVLVKLRFPSKLLKFKGHQNFTQKYHMAPVRQLGNYS